MALCYQVFGILCCCQVLSPDMSHILAISHITLNKILPYMNPDGLILGDVASSSYSCISRKWKTYVFLKKHMFFFIPEKKKV